MANKRQSSLAAESKAALRPARPADSNAPLKLILLAQVGYEYHASSNPAHNAIEDLKTSITLMTDSIGDATRRDLVNERIGNRMFALALPRLKKFVFNPKDTVSAAQAEALRDAGLYFHGKSEYVNTKNPGETRESRLEAAIDNTLDFQLSIVSKPTHAKKRKAASLLDEQAQIDAANAKVTSEKRKIGWNKKYRPEFYGFLEGAHVEFDVPPGSEFDSDFSGVVLEAAVDAAHIKLMADVVRCDELFQQADEDSDWEAECDNNLYLAEADLVGMRDFAKQQDVELRERKAFAEKK